MPPVEDTVLNTAEATPEFDTTQTGLTNEEDNGGTRQAGTDDKPKDVRSLLADAIKRGPDGKFVSKDGEPSTADTAQAGGPAAVPAPAEQPQNRTVTGLTSEEQTALSSLPDANREAVQALLVARGTAQAQAIQYAQQVSEQVRGYASIEQVLGPRRQAWAMTGVAPEQALNQLLALSDFAGRDPGEFVRWFAGQHGLDLYNLSQDYTPPDPQYVDLQRQVAELTSRLGSQQTQQQQQAHAGIMGEIAQFAQEAGDGGKPIRPHFDAVANDMLHILPAVMAQNTGMSRRDALQTAYDRAVWANPTTRALLQQEQDAASRAAAAAAAAQARTRSKSITGNAPAGDDPASTVRAAGKTVRGALEAAIAQHS